MRVASICARAGVVLREEGLRSFWFKVLGETVYRRMVVMELLVPLERRPTGPPVAGAVLRLVRQDDLDAYADLRGGHAEARKALALGERCLGTWLDGRLLTTHWFADRVARIEPLGRTIPLEHGEAYSTESSSRPTLAGAGSAGMQPSRSPRRSRTRASAGWSPSSTPRTLRAAGLPNSRVTESWARSGA